MMQNLEKNSASSRRFASGADEASAPHELFTWAIFHCAKAMMKLTCYS